MASFAARTFGVGLSGLRHVHLAMQWQGAYESYG